MVSKILIFLTAEGQLEMTECESSVKLKRGTVHWSKTVVLLIQW